MSTACGEEITHPRTICSAFVAGALRSQLSYRALRKAHEPSVFAPLCCASIVVIAVIEIAYVAIMAMAIRGGNLILCKPWPNAQYENSEPDGRSNT